MHERFIIAEVGWFTGDGPERCYQVFELTDDTSGAYHKTRKCLNDPTTLRKAVERRDALASAQTV